MLLDQMPDTGDFPTIQMRPMNNVRTWSNVRWGTWIILLLTTFAFVIGVIVQPRHGLSELPQIAIDVFRGYWEFAVVAVLVAWAYDAIAPKWLARLSAIREGIRAIEQTTDRQAISARIQEREARRFREDLTAVIANMADGQREALQALADRMDTIATQAADREVAEYTKGFNAALDRLSAEIPDPAPSPEDDDRVVRISTRRRHGS